MFKKVEELRKELKPLYENLLKNVTDFNDLVTFCVQWGENFPNKENDGILFVGQAINGWVEESESKDVNELFSENNDGIFNREDQMIWVEKSWGRKDGYNTKHSAFWRIIKSVATHFYPEKWYSHIAWSNVCKIASRKGGNPNDELFDTQFDDCSKILKTEIKILSPKAVVFLTGESWANDFLKYLNNKQEIKPIHTEYWDKYECKIYEIADIKIILSEHPKSKKEYPHKNCLIKMLESLHVN